MTTSSAKAQDVCKVCNTKLKPLFSSLYCPNEDKHAIDTGWDDVGTWPGWDKGPGNACECGAALQPFSAPGFGITAHCPACGKCY